MTLNTSGPMGSGQDLRRSPRFEIQLPIEVSWTTASGQRWSERAELIEANQHGGLLIMRQYPPMGTELEITNLLTGQTAGCRAVAMRHSAEERRDGLAVELNLPNEQFWGITYRLRRASLDLKNLEEAIKSGTPGLDLHILQEFRDAVDYVRKTAWVVYEVQERQIHHRDTATVMPLLTSERLRRTTQLCHAILADLAKVGPERYPGEVSAFFEAIQKVYRRLDPVVGASRPRVD